MQKVPLHDVLSIALTLAVTLATLPTQKAPAPAAPNTAAHLVAPVARNTEPYPLTTTAPRYKAVPIGAPAGFQKFRPVTISPNARYIVGFTDIAISGSPRQWFLWKEGVFEDMHLRQPCWMNAVNNNGVVVGEISESKGSSQAVVWEQGSLKRLFPDGPQSSAKRIDSAGAIYGEVAAKGSTRTDSSRAFVQNPHGDIVYFDAPANLVSKIEGVNDNQQAIVCLCPPGNTGEAIRKGRYFVWNPMRNTDAPRPNASELLPIQAGYRSGAMAINNRGEVVGYCIKDSDSRKGSEEDTRRLVLWKNGAPTYLPTPIGDRADVGDINNYGDSIGYTMPRDQAGYPISFVIHNGTYYALRDCLENAVDIRLAWQIADNGVILTDGGISAQEPQFYLLLPK